MSALTLSASVIFFFQKQPIVINLHPRADEDFELSFIKEEDSEDEPPQVQEEVKLQEGLLERHQQKHESPNPKILQECH